MSDQERWIEAQRIRAGDYYFVIETLDGRWEGVVSLYGIEDASGEWGRWILRRGSLAAPASVLLVFHFGFDQLGLRRIYGRTLAGERPVRQLPRRLRVHEPVRIYRNGRPGLCRALPRRLGLASVPRRAGPDGRAGRPPWCTLVIATGRFHHIGVITESTVRGAGVSAQTGLRGSSDLVGVWCDRLGSCR